MPHSSLPRLALAAVFGLMCSAAMAGQGTPQKAPHTHNHTHDHTHSHTQPQAAPSADAQAISAGYFQDDQVAPRPLSDWAGSWQSVYPYLLDGTLEPVFAHKAAQGGTSAAEYRARYEAGYRTTTDRITITAGGEFHFETSQGGDLRAQYESDGFEILTYAKGNRGVRFVFRKVAGDAEAPGYVQFSDHRIAPQISDHFHLYWGDDRAALLREVSHWPTYYPAALTGAGIAAEMMAH